MKTLYLVRHAKSSWDDPTLADHDRPLNERGKRDAPKMGERLAQRGTKVDLIISSSAARALATAQAIAEKIGYDQTHIMVDRRLYATQVSALLYLIQELDDQHERVMLFGHNPEFTDLARFFDSGIDELPTCAVVEMTFEVDRWSEVVKRKPATIRISTPKQPD